MSNAKLRGRPATTGIIEGDFALSVGPSCRPAPEGWHWTPLSSLARLESGHTPSRKHPEYWGGEIPWIGIRDATGNHGRAIQDTEQHTNPLGISKSAARILPVNTVCLSRTASVGYVVVMGRPMATSQDFANWVCGPGLDHRFLKYVLLAERDAFSRFSYGSTHQTIYFPELKAFHICLPERAKQEAIAAALSALDDKIELNRRMAATLEAMARALYRSWFVDFDPVHAKALGRSPAHMDAATAALFPDRFGEGGLPMGWRSGSLKDIAALSTEKWSVRSHPEILRYIDLSAVTAGTMEDPAAIGWTDAPSRARMILRPGDTILGTVRPGNRAFLLIGEDGLTGSTGFAVLRPMDFTDHGLLYVAATDADNIDRLAHLADGAAYPAVRPEVVAASPLVLAPPPIRQAFASMTTPMHARVQHAQTESRTLAALRDTLLPKLISGEIRVRDAEAAVEEAVA